MRTQLQWNGHASEPAAASAATLTVSDGILCSQATLDRWRRMPTAGGVDRIAPARGVQESVDGVCLPAGSVLAVFSSLPYQCKAGVPFSLSSPKSALDSQRLLLRGRTGNCTAGMRWPLSNMARDSSTTHIRFDTYSKALTKLATLVMRWRLDPSGAVLASLAINKAGHRP